MRNSSSCLEISKEIAHLSLSWLEWPKYSSTCKSRESLNQPWDLLPTNRFHLQSFFRKNIFLPLNHIVLILRYLLQLCFCDILKKEEDLESWFCKSVFPLTNRHSWLSTELNTYTHTLTYTNTHVHILSETNWAFCFPELYKSLYSSDIYPKFFWI